MLLLGRWIVRDWLIAILSLLLLHRLVGTFVAIVVWGQLFLLLRPRPRILNRLWLLRIDLLLITIRILLLSRDSGQHLLEM